MATLTKTWTFDSSVESWVVSGVITRITTDGSPTAGCLQGYIAGRNAGGTNNGQATWSGTYESLGIPSNGTITNVQATLMKKQTLTGPINNCYWDLNSTHGLLIDAPDDLTSFDWTQLIGTAINSLSVAATSTLDLTLTCSIRTGNDKNAAIDLMWDTIALEITYTVPFTAPSITTNAANPIAETTTTLNGNLSSLGDATSADVFFQYRKVGAGTWTDTTKQSRSTTGDFTQALSGLDSNSNYEFRAVAEYDNGGIQTVYGSTLTFDTLAYSYDLTVVVDGAGTTTPTAGVHSYTEGTIVNLSASPTEGNVFSKWVVDGADVFDANTTVTMTGNKTVTAYFVTLIYYDLTIQMVGNGTTTPSVGVHTYINGTNVALTAVANEYNQFSKWVIGGVDDLNASTSVTVTSNITATAHFVGENLIIVQKKIADGAWTELASISNAETSYKDISTFTKGTAYSYRIILVQDGVLSQSPPALSAAEFLTDRPSTILLTWGVA